jgi:endonuclease YncB( thermonuclease family)
MGNYCGLMNKCGGVDWSTIDDKSCKELSFKNQEIRCKVVSVYDGDTIKVVFPLGGYLYKWNCRISGVDTPELRTRCEAEKRFGYKVRDKLRDKILHKIIKIRCDVFDKYGRLLIIPIIDGENICEWLLENEYALKYDGGTKSSWKDVLGKVGGATSNQL